MKNLVLFLSLVIANSAFCLDQRPEASSINSSKNLHDFEKMLNFDELEDEMVKMNIIDSIKPIPPHPIIVWVRIIGLPMANAYFAVRRAVRSSWHTIAAFLKIKTAKSHEELI